MLSRCTCVHKQLAEQVCACVPSVAVALVASSKAMKAMKASSAPRGVMKAMKYKPLNMVSAMKAMKANAKLGSDSDSDFDNASTKADATYTQRPQTHAST